MTHSDANGLWVELACGIPFLGGLCAAGVGGMTCMGYRNELEHLQRWTKEGSTPMALNTAAVFMAVGLSLMILSLLVYKLYFRGYGRSTCSQPSC